MKIKSILLAALMAMSAGANATPAYFGHVPDQSTNNNTGTVEIGDIGNLMGNVCNQSGNNNDCAANIEKVEGDVTVQGGSTTINNAKTVYVNGKPVVAGASVGYSW